MTVADHHGRPPYRLYTVLCRKVASDCLMTVETNLYSVPPAYVGRTVEVHWSPEGAIQIYHHGTLIATHPRAHGQHQLNVDPVHYQALRRHPPEPSASPGPEESLALTARDFPSGANEMSRTYAQGFRGGPSRRPVSRS